MTDIAWLIVAISAFVGSHELLSHPLRAPLVAKIGERGFLIVYSLVAFATWGPRCSFGGRFRPKNYGWRHCGCTFCA